MLHARIKTNVAGTWINLQDAYVSEKSATGDWGQIGYSAPGVKASSGEYSSKEFKYTGADATWAAENLHDLNDCTAQENAWTLSAEAEGGVSTAMKVTASGVAECLNLTPSFAGLARTDFQ